MKPKISNKVTKDVIASLSRNEVIRILSLVPPGFLHDDDLSELKKLSGQEFLDYALELYIRAGLTPVI